MDNLSLSPEHPDHPSNEIHNAAYPTSDYQPSNHLASSSSSAATPQNGIGGAAAGAGRASGKFAELAVPSLATTSARDPVWQHVDVNVPGSSHLDPSLGPPPSYEQSQSQSQSSRPNTSHQAGSPQSIAGGNTSSSLSPASPNTSINSSTPLRPPADTYQTIGRASVERSGPVGGAPVPASPGGDVRVGSSSGNNPSSSSAGSQGAGFQEAKKHFAALKKRQRRKWWCIVLVGLVVFIVALCIGVYIGVKGIGDDKDKPPPREWEKKYRQPHPPWGPSWTSSASPTSTVYIIVEEPNSDPNADPDAEPAGVSDGD